MDRLAELTVLSLMGLSILALAFPLLGGRTILGEGVDELGDLEEAHAFLADSMQDGSRLLGGPINAGDVLETSERIVMVPKGMVGDVGTVDFCIELDGRAMQRRSDRPVVGRCDGLLMIEMSEPSLSR